MQKQTKRILLKCSTIFSTPLVGIFFMMPAFFFTAGFGATPSNYTYAVVISKAAYADAGWKAVADTLLKIHGKTDARLFTWTSSVNDCKSDLSAFMPTYIGFIARPATECNTSFVAAASALTRNLDADPYGDAYWGVITGFEAADALRAVTDTLLVKTVVLGANSCAYEPPLQRFYQAIGMTCDSYTQTDYIFPNTGGKKYTADAHPDNEKDRSKLICKWLNAEKMSVSVSGQGTIEGPVDCLVTGGHGNVDTWQCHYSDAGTEGYVRSQNGQLYGAPYSESDININARNPLIYWCASNCLMATPDSKNDFVYAAFHTGHAVQMFGFIPDAASGDDFASWGVYDRLTKFAGRYTLPQSFFVAMNNSIFETRHSTGQFDEAGVKSYWNAMGMYGDPAANVKFYDFGDSAKSYKENFSYTPNGQGKIDFEYTITPMAHDIEFGKGYCYAFRPVYFMPVRIDPASVSITKNEGDTAEITDNLILWEMLSTGKKLTKGSTKTLRFTAKLMNGAAVSRKTVSTISPLMNAQASMTPGNNGLLVHFQNIPAGKVAMTIIDASGKQLASSQTISRGTQRQSFLLPVKLAYGVGFLMLRNGQTGAKATIAISE